MLRKVLSVSRVLILTGAVVLLTTGVGQAAPRGGGFHAVGFQSGFDPRFNRGFFDPRFRRFDRFEDRFENRFPFGGFDPRFDPRINRGFFDPRFFRPF